MKYQFADMLINASRNSMKRTLWVYTTIIILFFSIITVLWNMYVSWIRNLFVSLDDFSNLTIPQSELFKIWNTSTFINIPFINLSLQISDASFIISLAFFFLVIWLFFSARRENHVVGKSLFLSLNEDNDIKKYIYYGISLNNLFSTISDRDDPISSLKYVESEKKVKFLRTITQFVFWAPSFAIFLIIVFDLSSIFLFDSFYRDSKATLIQNKLSMVDWWKIAIMEFIAFGFLIICAFLTHKSWSYERATNMILKEFATDKIKWD